MYIYRNEHIYIYIYYVHSGVCDRHRTIDMAVCISFLEDEEEGENDCVDNA